MRIINQKGFSGLDIVLAIALVATIGVAGYFAYQNAQTKDNANSVANTSATPKPSHSQTPTPRTAASPTPEPQSDSDLITAALVSYSRNIDHNPAEEATVEDLTIVGANAHGGAHSDSPSGYEFVAHKDSGTWTIVFRGQELPGKALGEKYSLPVGWYSTSY